MTDVRSVAPIPDALDVLRKARALIEKPEHWTQGAYARDALGEKCPDGDERAHSFCAIGAMWRVVPSSLSVADAAHALCRAAGIKTSIDAFNDGHTHAEVLAAFDKAIASLEDAAIGSKANRGPTASATAQTASEDQSNV